MQKRCHCIMLQRHRMNEFKQIIRPSFRQRNPKLKRILDVTANPLSLPAPSFSPPCSYQFASYFWQQRVCPSSLLLARTSSPPTSGGQECAPFSWNSTHVVLHYRFFLPSYSRGLENVSRESETKSVHVSLIWIQSLFSRRCHS